MRKRRFTQRALVLTSVRLPDQDRTLLYSAALQLGISQSEALRQAVREFATTVLLRPRAEHPARQAEG